MTLDEIVAALRKLSEHDWRLIEARSQEGATGEFVAGAEGSVNGRAAEGSPTSFAPPPLPAAESDPKQKDLVIVKISIRIS